MIALCRNKSIQIRLHENTSKLMKFIKSPQEMAKLVHMQMGNGKTTTMSN